MNTPWTVEQATSEDSQTMSELLLASAPRVLSKVLSDGKQSRTLEYLSYSLANKEGQYGYGNHYVVRYNHRVIAIGSSWHDQLPTNFDQATVNSLHHFFGIEECMQILQRSSVLSLDIAKPTSSQLIIGHLSTLPEFQRQGAAKALITYFMQQAHNMGKEAVVVDVERQNHQAQSCYQNLGFTSLISNEQSSYTRFTHPL